MIAVLHTASQYKGANYTDTRYAGSGETPTAPEQGSGTKNTNVFSTASHPTKCKLHIYGPNPSTPETTIRHGLPESAEGMIEICDVRGRRWRTPVPTGQGAGGYEAIWDGYADRGDCTTTRFGPECSSNGTRCGCSGGNSKNIDPAKSILQGRHILNRPSRTKKSP